ncbi:MAG: hypothetical protein GY778_02920 [bacterium]|nr:hypothetical protein [bacterium]
MTEFVSECISPWAGTSDAADMGRGLPGLPRGFDWRDGRYEVVRRLAQWKDSSREGGHAGGELYLRRHYHRLEMSDGSVWTVYFLRQAPRSGSAKRRWFLYRVEEAAQDRPPTQQPGETDCDRPGG